MDDDTSLGNQKNTTGNVTNNTSSSSRVSSQTRSQKSSPRVSPRTSWNRSGNSSPRASSSHQQIGGAKRDREVQSGEEDNESMSLESSSDDSHESIKKIRKDTTTEGASQKTTQIHLKKSECSSLPERKQTSKNSDNESDDAMSCDLNKESHKSRGKANKKKRNKDRKVDTKDVHEELQKMTCGRDEEEDTSTASNMVVDSNDVSRDDSLSLPSCSGSNVGSKTNNSNSNNKVKTCTNGNSSKSKPSDNQSACTPLVGGGPNKRRRSRSYRPRRLESSDEGGDEDHPDRLRTSESRSPSAESRKASNNSRQRSSNAHRRGSGELRESSAAGNSRISRPCRSGNLEAVPSRDSRSPPLASFLNTSDNGLSSNDSDDDEDGEDAAQVDPPHHAVAVTNATLRPLRSSSRGRAAASHAVGDSVTTSASDAPTGEGDASTEESVAERVRRRREGRGSRGGEFTTASTAAFGSPRDGNQTTTSLMLSMSNYSLSSDSDRDENDVDDASSDSDSDENDDDEDSNLDEDQIRPLYRRRQRPMPDEDEQEIQAKVKAIKDKSLPKHDFHMTRELINRQYGGGVCGPRVSGGGCSRNGWQFSQRYYSSLHTVQHLSLMSNLNHHQGCVNAVSFSNSGSVLLSGSDDLQVALWDWNREKLLMAFESGHRNNVFQCKFLPLPGDRHIVTCARDGQVRLAEVSDAVCRSTRRLAKHSGPSHKLAVTPARPHVVLSAGEDGEVKEADLRQERANTLTITTNSSGARVALYSIHNHPLNENQFCVAGRDPYICVYDRRITTTTAPPVLKYCPDHLVSSRPRASVTCAVYSNNGDGILASYNDEDIYLFDTGASCYDPPKHRYSGHRNSATVKGVNLFGPRSQYVMSGSDCGNIFIWSRETEAIVRCFNGDETGVVNVLEWHPHLPLLATSGLDSDVKVWIPSSHGLAEDDELEEMVMSNLRERRHSSHDLEFTDSRMVTMIWDQMRRLQSRGGEGWRRRGAGSSGAAGEQPHPQEEQDSDSSEEDTENPFTARNLQCATQ